VTQASSAGHGRHTRAAETPGDHRDGDDVAVGATLRCLADRSPRPLLDGVALVLRALAGIRVLVGFLVVRVLTVRVLTVRVLIGALVVLRGRVLVVGVLVVGVLVGVLVVLPVRVLVVGVLVGFVRVP
jgi:hypothetical protein